jgi:putative ABC transport system permease protein
MTQIFLIVVKSLINRRLTSCLTIVSIAVSVCLLLGIEKIRIGAREGFSQTISQTDLIVGASGGSIQLLLYSVFHIGDAPKNISLRTYETFQKHPSVEWTIPLSMGDSHKGYRVIATDHNFFEHFRFRGDESIRHESGEQPKDVFDVSIGFDVAKKLNYHTGDSIVIAHGTTDGPALTLHDDKPFKVSGILAKTNTPIDTALYITLEGMEAIHMDWSDGVAPSLGNRISPETIRNTKIDINVITSFLLRTKNRIETLRLQREINQFDNESIQAIIPGVALSELWSNINYAEMGMRTISAFVVIVGMIGMLVAVYSSLNERRREIAIFRAIGTGFYKIAMLLIFEALILTLAGVAAGVLATYTGLYFGQGVLQSFIGFRLPIAGPTNLEFIYMFSLIASGTFIGLIPAYRAYKNSLSDGLAIRT